MSQFDQRQIEKMYQLVVGFREDTLSLASLISGLEFLYHALGRVDASWEKSFLEEIANLESVNAGTSSILSEAAVKRIVDRSVATLHVLIEDSRGSGGQV